MRDKFRSESALGSRSSVSRHPVSCWVCVHGNLGPLTL
jgi:hypothetical protein